MIKINNNNHYIEFEFNGLKIIQTDNPTLLVKNLLINNISIDINNESFSKNDLIILNELTKFNDLLKFNKNSPIFKLIFNELEESPILNIDNITKIADKINKEYFNILDVMDGDLNKIILSLFDFMNLDFLNKEKLLFLIQSIFTEKKYTFVLDNLNYIKYKDLLPFLNMHNFIIVTNDFRQYINNINDLELLYISDDNFNGVDIISSDILKNYLEKELSIIFDNSLMNQFLNNDENNLNIENIFFTIKKIKI